MMMSVLKLSDDQEEAVRLVLGAKVGVVTGPPGSGKSTILGAALGRLPGSERVVLMAPTGKAAKRLREVTAYPAATIHRSLGAVPTSGGWTWAYHSRNPLPFDVVIVDEASMIDTGLAAALLNAIDANTTRLILVGDVDQLPSVGPGRVFSDMIESGLVPTARLRTVHRAAASTWVYRVAPRILKGEWEHAEGDPTYKPCWVSHPATAATKLVEIVAARMKGASIKDYQVLAPMYDGPLGVSALNNALQEALNPREYTYGEPELEYAGRDRSTDFVIRARDLVIQQVNDYERVVFNGELGRVESITADSVRVEFDERLVTYTYAEARFSLRLAYAITIHRFQGSEVKWAVVACHSSHSHMWTRQLLYTAVTRAREGVVVVGDRSALATALSRDEPAQRLTTLKARLVTEAV